MVSNKYICLILLTCSFTNVTLVSAEQTDFKKIVSKEVTHYLITYRSNAFGGLKTIAFTLDNKDIEKGRQTLRQHAEIDSVVRQKNQQVVENTNQQIQSVIEHNFQALYEQAQSQASLLARRYPPGTTINVTIQDKNLQLTSTLQFKPGASDKENRQLQIAFTQELETLARNINAQAKEHHDQINQLVIDSKKGIENTSKEIFNSELKKSYATIVNSDNEFIPIIQVDYRQVVLDYKPALANLAKQFSNTASTRELIATITSFFQSIPYQAIEDKDRFSALGIVLPTTLLDNNLGDCDTKAIAAASTLLNHLPGLPLLLVLVPEHALLAAAIKSEPGDSSITKDGITYVLFEVAGPAMTIPGEVYPKTKEILANHQVIPLH
ncbi:MAG: hypothetical protein QM538_05105 [Methylacidiphilales bacterium]|nr:hypothetical protein [Candidatus Methylacidiphilales bacterium]